MSKKVLLLGLVGVAALVALFALSSSNAQDVFLFGSDLTQEQQEFLNFIAKHGKLFASADEFQHRFRVFADNYKMIQETNAQGNAYTLGVNKFADLTFEEFQRTHLGRKPARSETSSQKIAPVTGKYVEKVDWRDENVVQRVKDQGACGSCWTFGATGSVESAHALKHGDLLDLSEQQIVDCCVDYSSDGCNGGWETDAFKYLQGKKQCLTADYQ